MICKFCGSSGAVEFVSAMGAPYCQACIEGRPTQSETEQAIEAVMNDFFGSPTEPGSSVGST